jgi:hypothetical protein
MSGNKLNEILRNTFPIAIIVAAAFGSVLLFQFLFPAPFAIAPGDTVTVQDPIPNQPPAENTQTPQAPVATPQPQPTPSPTASNAILHSVPFVAQAPTGNWHDDRYQNACEESSILMAWHWITGQPLTPQIALDIIADMVVFEQENYGFYIDSSAADSAKLMREYFNFSGVSVKSDVSVSAIKNELASGNLVIVPADGNKLANPNFTPPGPARHMLVIKGYDDARGVFITNDPGTRNGESYEYSYLTLFSAIRDYPSGDHLPILAANKAMIVVAK